VAVNPLEIVGECEGKDLGGQHIVRFLVFMHFRVHRLEDLFLVEGVWRLREYPVAPDSSVFLARARLIEELPPPGPYFDIPPSPSPSLLIRLIPSVLANFLSHCYLV
jgi:hypothetical protein